MKAAIIILSVVVVGLVALLWWLMKAFGDTFKWNREMKEKITNKDRSAINDIVPDKVAKDWLRNQELCMEVCTGSMESDCCGAKIKHGDICSDCGEHCSNQCVDCELKDKCMNYNEKWD